VTGRSAVNYIKSLEQQLEEANQDKAWALEALTDLKVYLNSNKFTSESSGDRRFLVNTQDVLDRLNSAILAVLP
jgi:membrane carboxypeptidase/penicillin-binding protein